ncbi:MAG TPA: hypothetical protein P5210_16270 [Draconibacterium sp.]|nr:hypothetical protein [Draconibacterium sp.]
MENDKMTSNDYFKSVQIIHLALIAGVVILGIFTFSFHTSGLEMDGGKELNFALIYVVPVFSIAGIIASNVVFKQRLKDCIARPNLKEKLNCYRSALIVKFSFIEGSSFFALIAFLLTGDLLYLGFAALLLIVFITYTPSKEKSIVDLELTQAEKQIIFDADAIID